MRSRDIEWCDEPTMNPSNTEQLRLLIERWQIATLWAHRHRIKPRLVSEVFGDGLRLLAIYPTMYRPNHFVVRMDSQVGIDYADEWLDPILDAIEDEFYEWPWARAYGLRWHEDETADRDSRISFEDGCSWSELRWPRLKQNID